MRPTRFAFAIGLLLIATGVARAQAWPEMKMPPGAKVQSIAGDMVFNGRPARLSRFDFSGTEQDVVNLLRDQFGSSNVIENRLKGDRLVSVRQGDYFLTVALHSTGSTAVQATVMSTNVGGKRLGSQVASDTRQMLPAESRVVSTLQSVDGGKHSLMLTVLNSDSVAANRDYIAHALQQRGFGLTQESTAPQRQGTALSQQWNSSSEEAQVTISDAGKYRSVIINRVREAR